MAVKLRTMDGKTEIYRTHYGVGGDEYGFDKYVTKCGMEWKKEPKPFQTCDHIDCALDIQRQAAKAGSFAFFLIFVSGFFFCIWLISSATWALIFCGVFILASIADFIAESRAEQRVRELTEYLGRGTINGIRAYMVPASEELSELTTARDCTDYGLALKDNARYDDAIRAFDKAIGLDPENCAAWENKSNTLILQGKYDEALNVYSKALEFNNNEKLWLNRGTILIQQGRYEEAVQACDAALKINPRYRESWYKKGLALSYQGKYDKAIEAYDTIIELDRKDPDAWYEKGKALMSLGNTKEADAAFDRAKRKWNCDATKLFNFGEYEEAIEEYNKALKADPKYVNAWINKGTALYKLNRHSEAVEAFNQAIKLDPQRPDAWHRKGVAFKKMGCKVEANVAFARAKELGYTSRVG